MSVTRARLRWRCSTTAKVTTREEKKVQTKTKKGNPQGQCPPNPIPHDHHGNTLERTSTDEMRMIERDDDL